MRFVITVLIMSLCEIGFPRFTCAAFDTVINLDLPGQKAPAMIESNTQVNVTGSASLPDGFQAGNSNGSSSNIEVNFSGLQTGTIHAYAGSVLNLSHGTVWGLLMADFGSVVNVSGDTFFLNNFLAVQGSTFNISGGNIYSFSGATDGAKVNIFGGVVKDNFAAWNGGIICLLGGTVGDAFRIRDSSQLRIVGSDFRINGVEVDGLPATGDPTQVNVPTNAVLSGTLSDGTPFAFSAQNGDELPDGSVHLSSVAVPAILPGDILIDSPSELFGTQQSQRLVVQPGGKIRDQFNAGYGSVVEINGGELGAYFEALNSEVTIVDGAVGEGFNAYHGTKVRVVGGKVGANFGALNGSLVKISGGEIGPYFDARAGSSVLITGGAFGEKLRASEGSSVEIDGGVFAKKLYVHGGAEMTIGGGSFDLEFRAYDGSNVNLLGRDFKLNGVPIAGLVPGMPTLIGNRNVTLSGMLADGSPFSFELSDTDYERTPWGAWLPYDYFGANAQLAVTLVPEPMTTTILAISVVLSSVINFGRFRA